MKYNIIDTMLSYLEVRHTKWYTDSVYNTHPHKYDMYGLYDILVSYGVNAMGVNFADKDCSHLTFPCILYINGDFVVASGISGEKIHYNWNGRKFDLPLNDFRSVWTGNAIVVDGESNAVEPNLKQHEKKYFLSRMSTSLFVVIIALAVFFACYINHEKIGLTGFLLLLLDGAGIFTSSLLMEKTLHKNSLYGDKVCSLFHQKDCNGILMSDKSSIFGISWSEIGFSYFLSHIVVIAAFPRAISTISIMDTIIVCYPIWSIYYQWKVARQWCVLCVFVQFVLVAEGILGMGYVMNDGLQIDSASILIFGAVFYILLLISHKYVTGYKAMEENVSNLQRLRALKANHNIFHTLIKEEKYNNDIEKASTILFGNPKASMRITILTNPHCNPCAKMHGRIENMFESKHDKICIQYIFSAFNESLESSNKFLIAIYQQFGKEKAWKIYSDWYRYGKYHAKDFMNQYKNINYNDLSVLEENKKHFEWKQKSGYMATPTILVNGYELTREYTIEDIKMLL